MAFPQALATRFFQLVNNRQFTEAQRELQRIKGKTPQTDWNNGYSHALHGMLLAQKANGNKYTFLANLNPNQTAELEQHKSEFVKHVQSRFKRDSDRGFFSAWIDYTRLLIKAINDTKAKSNSNSQMSIIQYAERPTTKTMKR